MAEPIQPPESKAGASSSTPAVPSENPPDVAAEDESDPDFDDLDGTVTMLDDDLSTDT